MINKNEFGSIEISQKAYEDMVMIAIKGVKGVAPSKKDTNKIECTFKNDELKLHIEVKMKSGIDVVKTSNKLQNKIHEIILEMTGIDCKNIDVEVVGFVA